MLIYFLPGETVPTPAEVSAVIGDVLIGASLSTASVTGPDGPGHLVSLGEVKLRYEPTKQRWRAGPKRADGRRSFYVGCWAESVPGPAALARPRQYGGRRVTLLDGHEWLVPRLAIATTGEHDLPQVADLDDDGQTVMGVIDQRYQTLAAAAIEHVLYLVRAVNQPPAARPTDPADLAVWQDQEAERAREEKRRAAARIDLLVAALAVNYRMEKVAAVGLLKLFDTPAFDAIEQIVLDLDEIEAVSKNDRASGTGATDSGVPGAAS
jgi:hypothetical protein